MEFMDEPESFPLAGQGFEELEFAKLTSKNKDYQI